MKEAVLNVVFDLKLMTLCVMVSQAVALAASMAILGAATDRKRSPPRNSTPTTLNGGSGTLGLAGSAARRGIEPPRLSRRLVGLSHAVTTDSVDCE